MARELEAMEEFLGEVGEAAEEARGRVAGIASYRHCSATLGRLDNQVTLMRSVMKELHTGNLDLEACEEQSSSDLWKAKLSRRVSDIVTSSRRLVGEVAACRARLVAAVKEVASEPATSFEGADLATVCSLATGLVEAREEEVVRVWEVIQDWRQVLGVRVSEGVEGGELLMLNNNQMVMGTEDKSDDILKTVVKADSEVTVEGKEKTVGFVEKEDTVETVGEEEVTEAAVEEVTFEENVNSTKETRGQRCGGSSSKDLQALDDSVVTIRVKVKRARVTCTPPPPRSIAAPPPPGAPSSLGAPLVCSTPLPSEHGEEPAAPAQSYSQLAQAKLLERLRAEFGVWGRPVSPSTTYSRYRVRFEGGGSTAALWITFDTAARDALQARLQQLVVGAVPSAAAASHLVLARWTDGQVYRARVVAGGAALRYIDYGNSGEVGQVYPWERALEVVPPQALLCRLLLPPGAPALQWTSKEADAFGHTMLRAGAMRMEVHQRLQPPGHLLRPSADPDAPEAVVSLHTRTEASVLELLARQPLLARHFPPPSRPPRELPVVQPLVLHPPPPAHLEGVEVEEVAPSSPIHQNFLNLAVTNCRRWLEHHYVEGAGLEEGE